MYEDIVSMMKMTIDFDTFLMVHLGEEEEIVVPVSLLTGHTENSIAM